MKTKLPFRKRLALLKAAFFPKTIFSGFSFSNINTNHAAFMSADME